MNEQDKKAFNEWHEMNIFNPPTLNDLITKAWSDACEYKQKEIDYCQLELSYRSNRIKFLREKSVKLQEQNKKLRECVETIAKELYGRPSEMMQTTRQVLKEIEE